MPHMLMAIIQALAASVVSVFKTLEYVNIKARKAIFESSALQLVILILPWALYEAHLYELRTQHSTDLGGYYGPEYPNYVRHTLIGIFVVGLLGILSWKLTRMVISSTITVNLGFCKLSWQPLLNSLTIHVNQTVIIINTNTYFFNEAQGTSIEVQHCNAKIDIRLPNDNIYSSIVASNIWNSRVIDSTYASVHKTPAKNRATTAEIDGCDKVDVKKAEIAKLTECDEINISSCKVIEASHVKKVFVKKFDYMEANDGKYLGATDVNDSTIETDLLKIPQREMSVRVRRAYRADVQDIQHFSAAAIHNVDIKLTRMLTAADALYSRLPEELVMMCLCRV